MNKKMLDKRFSIYLTSFLYFFTCEDSREYNDIARKGG